MHSTVIISSLLGLAAAAPRAILEDAINKRLNGQTVTVTVTPSGTCSVPASTLVSTQPGSTIYSTHHETLTDSQRSNTPYSIHSLTLSSTHSQSEISTQHCQTSSGHSQTPFSRHSQSLSRSHSQIATVTHSRKGKPSSTDVHICDLVRLAKSAKTWTKDTHISYDCSHHSFLCGNHNLDNLWSLCSGTPM